MKRFDRAPVRLERLGAPELLSFWLLLSREAEGVSGGRCAITGQPLFAQRANVNRGPASKTSPHKMVAGLKPLKFFFVHKAAAATNNLEGRHASHLKLQSQNTTHSFACDYVLRGLLYRRPPKLKADIQGLD